MQFANANYNLYLIVYEKEKKIKKQFLQYTEYHFSDRENRKEKERLVQIL